MAWLEMEDTVPERSNTKGFEYHLWLSFQGQLGDKEGKLWDLS